MSSRLIEAAFVVSDLKQAIAEWTGGFGVGPFFVAEFHTTEQHYRGMPTPKRSLIGFGYTNGVLIELIQPLDGPPCVFSEALERLGPSFHHHLYEVPDHDVEVTRLTALGFEVVQAGQFAGTPFSIVDTRRVTGAYTEVMAFHAGLRGLYERVRSASEAWDGISEPERALNPAAG